MKTKRTIKKGKPFKQRRSDDMAENRSDESASIKAARETERQAAEAAQQACSIAEAAQRAVEQANQVLNEKEKQVSEVRTEFEAVGERLAATPLDDPGSERLGGRHRHLEIVLRRLEGECGGLKESLAVAEKRAEVAVKAAEVADARLRNAQRQVKLQRLCVAFPVALDKLLDLIRGRNQVLSAADEEARVHDLPRPDRCRLLPREDQLRRHEMYEAGIILTRHQVGLAMTPAASFSDFAMEPGVSEAAIPNSEEEWAALTAEAIDLDDAPEPDALGEPDQGADGADWLVLAGSNNR